LSANGLKLERIAKSQKVIHGCRGKAKADMKIELLVESDLISGAKVQQMLRTSALRKIARVLDESISPILG